MPKELNVFVKTACQNNVCKSHRGNSHLQTHVVIDLDLVVGSESYRCVTLQCEECGHHSLFGITFPVTTGTIHKLQ